MEERQYNDSRKSIKGYQIVIVILALILAALSYMFYSQTKGMKADFAVQRDTLENQLARMVTDLDGLRTTNDTISYNLGVERGKADSLLQKLQNERRFSATKIRQYEKELGTLRTVLRGFVVTIDSLNNVNKTVIKENLGLKDRIATAELEVKKAQETADELNVKVRQASVIYARAINLLALSANDKEVTRASRAARMRVDFILSANSVAPLGTRNVYARIQGPDGYQMAIAGSPSFTADGSQLTYSAMREIDYQGQDLSVRLYYTGGGITDGKYVVTIFMDGHQIGSNEIILK